MDSKSLNDESSMNGQGTAHSANHTLPPQNNGTPQQPVSFGGNSGSNQPQSNMSQEQPTGFQQSFSPNQNFQQKLPHIGNKASASLRQLQQFQVSQGIKRKNLSPQPVSIDLVHQGEQKKSKLDMNKYLQVQQNALHMSRLQAAQVQAQAQSQAQNHQNNMGVMNNVVVSMPMGLGGLNINQPFQGVIGNPFLNLYGLQALQQQSQNQLAKQENANNDRNASNIMNVQHNQTQQQNRNILQTMEQKAPRNPVVTNAGPSDGDSKKQKVSEALHYLAEVKKKFKGNVRVYCLFLDIMKKFKSNQVDTPGVLKEVINLFSRQEELITGFNKFLPAGFTVQIGKFENSPPRCVRVFLPTNEFITLDLDRLQFDEFDEKMKKVNARISADILYYNANANAAKKHRNTESKPNETAESSKNNDNNNVVNVLNNNKFNPTIELTNLNQLGGGVASLQALSQGNGINIGFPVPIPNLSQLNPSLNQSSIQGLQNSANGGLSYIDNEAGKNKQKVNGKSEFSEAIHYVSKIKRRFAHDSAAYRSFLDILHIYQKDQGTIKKVLQKVAKLFEGHNDLLKEFCFFLPDESRNKAKKIVDDILRRKDAENGIDKVDKYEDKFGERMLWQRIKDKFRDTKLYTQFLGTLELFMKACISKTEFLELVSCLMRKASNPVDVEIGNELDGSCTKLLELLDSFLCSNNIVDSPVLSAFFSLPRTDMDFGDSFRPTPSYRQLPDAYLRYSDPKIEEKGNEKVRYRLNACSGRTRLCDTVLNDKYVSVSTGSEDDFSFKHFRKNIYEEALFRCEDERHAFDMVMEWNRRAINHLTMLEKEINKFEQTALVVKDNDENTSNKAAIKFRLGKDSLTVLHVKAIARAYGSYANEILELLRLTPHVTVPIVLSRLKEQDIILSQRKEMLNIEWGKIHQQNFYKSLDHRSFYFKQTDKKEVGTKSLLGQIKAIYKNNTADLKGHKSEFVKFIFNNETVNKAKTLGDELSDRVHLELEFNDISIHKQCFSILLFMLRRVEVSSRSAVKSQQQNSAKMLAFIVNVLMPFFGLEFSDFEVEQGDLLETDIFLSAKAKELISLAFLKNQAPNKDARDEGTVEPEALKMQLKSFKATNELFTDGSMVFYGSSSLFLFFRLYNILYERILRAKYASEDAALNHRESEKANDPVLSAEDRFLRVMNGLHSLIAGEMDSSAFEDLCRTVLRSGSYVLFTLEKILSLLDKHMENGILSEEKFKSFFKKVNDFCEVTSNSDTSDLTSTLKTDKLVQVYRQCYQTMMNQVDGLCYRLVLVLGEKSKDPSGGSIWKIKPTVKATLTKSFPTVSLFMKDFNENVTGEPHILLPLEVNLQKPKFTYEWTSENKHQYRGCVPLQDKVACEEAFFSFPVLCPLKLKLDTDQLTDIGEIGKTYINKKRVDYEEGTLKAGAKSEWWFFGNYEECRSEKQGPSSVSDEMDSDRNEEDKREESKDDMDVDKE